MKNFFYILIGLLFGWLLAERSFYKRQALSTMQPTSTPPQRRSRTLEQIAPVLVDRPHDATDFRTKEMFVHYLHDFVDEVMQPNLTEHEAHLAAEMLKFEMLELVSFDADLATRQYIDDTKNNLKWMKGFDDEQRD